MSNVPLPKKMRQRIAALKEVKLTGNAVKRFAQINRMIKNEAKHHYYLPFKLIYKELDYLEGLGK